MIPARDLEPRHIAHWTRLQESDPALASPFFRPEFTQAVASARSDGHVGIIEQDGMLAGFFPFQRGRLPAGIPIGEDRSNYQGLIVDPELSWDAVSLVRECGLRIWDFHHLITAQKPFEPFWTTLDDSPVIDLSDGFDAYVERRESNGSRVIRRLRQQVRRVEREVGPVRFEPHVADIAVLRTLMEWKSRQYLETGNFDRFAVPWNVRLLEEIHRCQQSGFQGMLPALYIGDELAAVAMCMRSHHVVHYWFPSYQPDLASFSPGLLLLFELAQRADELGIGLIDLGKGHAPYKDRLASGVIQVASGSVLVPSAMASARKARLRVERSVRTSRLRAPARRIARAAREYRSSR